jgi:hypothetical protein
MVNAILDLVWEFGIENFDMYDGFKIITGSLKGYTNTTSIMNQTSMRSTKDKISLFYSFSLT